MKITAGTIARTIILALALVNQLLSATGHAIIPIEDDTVETLVSTAITIITALIAWWKNNSFTHAALVGDIAMRRQRYNDREDKRLTVKKDTDDDDDAGLPVS